MSGTNDHSGWLPVAAREKLESEGDRASAAATEDLLALDPRARVLALMERAASHAVDDPAHPVLRPADLARLLESFPGAEPASADDLAQRFPTVTSLPG